MSRLQRVCTRCVASTLFLIIALLSDHVAAHMNDPRLLGAPHDGRYFNPVVGGLRVDCDNFFHQSVVLISDHNLGDVGRANPFNGTIRMNPHVLVDLPKTLQLFWYGHECGHHGLHPSEQSDEAIADCFAIRAGIERRWFDRRGVNEIALSVHRLHGDWFHAPGPVRASALIDCNETVTTQVPRS